MAQSHYAHVRHLGMNGRIKREAVSPLRKVGKSVGIWRKGFILPVVAIDGEGFACIDITDKSNALAAVPRTSSGQFDAEAVNARFPVIEDPHAFKALKGLKLVGEAATPSSPDHTSAEHMAKMRAAKAAKAAKAAPAKAEPVAKAEPKAPKPAAIELTADAVATYLAGLNTAEQSKIIAKMTKLTRRAK